jgi:glycosyltransferase involved in cell wall biosynthesis
LRIPFIDIKKGKKYRVLAIGLSIAVLEAMFYGKAVLVSNIAENLEIISGNTKTGTVGFDFENKNILDLTKKLKLLISDPQIVHRVGKKAKEYVKIYYNWDKITDRTERVYKNIILIKDKIPSKFKLALAKYIF